jgi:hypothetical protein
LQFCELSDLIGAIEDYILPRGLTLEDLKNSPIKQRNHFRRVKDELDRRRKK